MSDPSQALSEQIEPLVREHVEAMRRATRAGGRSCVFVIVGDAAGAHADGTSRTSSPGEQWSPVAG